MHQAGLNIGSGVGGRQVQARAVNPRTARFLEFWPGNKGGWEGGRGVWHVGKVGWMPVNVVA